MCVFGCYGTYSAGTHESHVLLQSSIKGKAWGTRSEWHGSLKWRLQGSTSRNTARSGKHRPDSAMHAVGSQEGEDVRSFMKVSSTSYASCLCRCRGAYKHLAFWLDAEDFGKHLPGNDAFRKSQARKLVTKYIADDAVMKVNTFTQITAMQSKDYITPTPDTRYGLGVRIKVCLCR